MKYFPERLNMTWVRECYADGSLTPFELIEEIIKRSEETKDKNIWIVPPSVELIKPYLDKLAATEVNSLPLWGIPFAIKDNIDLADVPTTAACKEFSYIPKKSATVVERLILAGAVPVGKANLDQFATGLVGTRSPYGEVHNSLNPELISGGSSSGSAVSVGLGQAVFSLGTDTAGSGRVPAALNCLVGFKPSVGAWSSKGVVPACASLDCVTVFANNFQDAEAVDEIARGFDEDCCWSKEFDVPFEKLPEKICLPKETPEFYGRFGDIFKAKWEKAVSRIKDLGIPIEYIDYSFFSKAAAILYDGPWVAERWKDLGDFVLANPDAIFPVTKTILSSGGNSELTAVKCFEAIHTLAEYKAMARKILKDAVLIMPTAGGTFSRDEVRLDPISTNSKMGLYTNHCNLLDLCAIALPEDSNDFEMPFGITIFALSQNEGLVFGTADKFLSEEMTEIAVCGLHMKDLNLEYQIKELGGKFDRHSKTADCYRLFKLDTTPIKPGLEKDFDEGAEIDVDIYKIPKAKLGLFLLKVSAPLCLGRVLLSDGKEVIGFLCEKYSAEKGEDITKFGGFKKAF